MSGRTPICLERANYKICLERANYKKKTPKLSSTYPRSQLRRYDYME